MLGTCKTHSPPGLLSPNPTWQMKGRCIEPGRNGQRAHAEREDIQVAPYILNVR